MNKQRGFTLIELMIVVAIVAIIASIAYPSYQAQVLKTRRADAHASLTDISARQERFMAQRNTYTTEISATSGLGLGRTTSEDGFYNITVDPCAGRTIADCYVITATAVSPQDQDTECAIITLNSAGLKSGTTAGDACW